MTEPRLRDRDSRRADPPDGVVFTDSEGSGAAELSIVGLPEIDLSFFTQPAADESAAVFVPP
jgi:hypothetical protein